ncbi:hypothetical protein AN958_05272 [Leucoagaricus sp. SymC.cos]|nr:hypothetical protein AN958_05272 [Leucoagaricus sp. SymC.cos]
MLHSTLKTLNEKVLYLFLTEGTQALQNAVHSLIQANAGLNTPQYPPSFPPPSLYIYPWVPPYSAQYPSFYGYPPPGPLPHVFPPQPQFSQPHPASQSLNSALHSLLSVLNTGNSLARADNSLANVSNLQNISYPVTNPAAPFIPLTHPPAHSAPPAHIIPPVPSAPPPPPAPTLSIPQPQAPSVPAPNPSVPSSVPAPPATVPSDSSEGEWDGFPDGKISRNFTMEQQGKGQKIYFNWAHRTDGRRTGDPNATEWKNGRQSIKTCLGILTCGNPDCKIIARVGTKDHVLQKQLEKPCRWGIWFYQNETHGHDRPSHELHVSPEGVAKFVKLILQHPEAGPRRLQVGIRHLDGNVESVTDYSNVYHNVSRVSKDRREIIGQYTNEGGDPFFKGMRSFSSANPGFIVGSQLGEANIICFQTPFMRRQLLHDGIETAPLNGIVSDAAHKWWKDFNSVLIVSSVYCVTLGRWVPGLISFADGTKTDHFYFHFLVMMRSMSAEASERGILIDDELFANVVDFSRSERKGFINAFVTFQTERGDPRTPEELRRVALTLLRGCEVHFKSGGQKMSKVSGAVPVHRKKYFLRQVYGLLDVPDYKTFREQAKHIMQEFPLTDNWLSWWLEEDNASILFKPLREMPEELAKTIPNSTNAEESMHWKQHTKGEALSGPLVGVPLQYGTKSKVTFQKSRKLDDSPTEPPEDSTRDIKRPQKLDPYLLRLSEDVKSPPLPTIGELVKNSRKSQDARAPSPVSPDPPPHLHLPHPGTQHHFQSTLQAHPDLDSLVKKSQSAKEPRQVYDGRAPDNATKTTHPEHLQRSPNKRMADRNNILSQRLGFISYKWADNSCWLDTSLELLNAVLRRREPEVTSLADRLNPQAPLKPFMDHIFLRWAKEANERNDFYPLFAWLESLLSKESNGPAAFRLTTYFQPSMIEVHWCSGSADSTGGPHVEIFSRPRPHSSVTASDLAHKIFGGSLANWFEDWISMPDCEAIQTGCWRNRDGHALCSGIRFDVRNVVLSIPVVLIVEFEQPEVLLDNPVPHINYWDIPQTLNPLWYRSGKTDAKIQYDIVGLALMTDNKSHFSCQYQQDGHIWLYDGLRNKGHVKHQKGAKSARVMDQLPDVEYVDSKLTKMKPEDRYWMSNPASKKTTEYISIPNATKPPADNASPLAELPSLLPSQSFSDGLTTHAPAVEKVPPPPTPPSPPLSQFDIFCHCGMIGDGNYINDPEKGQSIECSQCRKWSHIACQRYGLAALLDEDSPFICEGCSLVELERHLKGQALPNPTERNQLINVWRVRRPLAERLRPGVAALALAGAYYYPVHLIQYWPDRKKWVVRWWIGCVFGSSVRQPDTVTVEPVENIVDALWSQRKPRRMIPLGFWWLACNFPDQEDRLLHTSWAPYTEEVKQALGPHTELLRQLLIDSTKVDSKQIPALEHGQQLGSRDYLKRAVRYGHVGGLSHLEQARIYNWLEDELDLTSPTAKTSYDYDQWSLVRAHALTLFLVHRMRNDSKAKNEQELLWEVWLYQMKKPPPLEVIDIYLESVAALECLMFEVSSEAGLAGQHQWGLDVGDHQDKWDPYRHVPDDWIDNSIELDQKASQRGPDYVELTKSPSPAPKGSRLNAKEMSVIEALTRLQAAREVYNRVNDTTELDADGETDVEMVQMLEATQDDKDGSAKEENIGFDEGTINENARKSGQTEEIAYEKDMTVHEQSEAVGMKRKRGKGGRGRGTGRGRSSKKRKN